MQLKFPPRYPKQKRQITVYLEAEVIEAYTRLAEARGVKPAELYRAVLDAALPDLEKQLLGAPSEGE
jgi:hypothetical protein